MDSRANIGYVTTGRSGEWAPAAREVPGSSNSGVLNLTLGLKQEPPRVRTMSAVYSYCRGKTGVSVVLGTARRSSGLCAHRVDQGPAAVAMGCEISHTNFARLAKFR